jgi:membrane protease subunit (stomatin/prohibitin family)
MFRLEVIDFFDHTNQALVARVPEHGSAAIQWGAQLIVQQSQVAVFFRDGRAMDEFGQGRHTLTTANLPIIGKILSIPFDKSPFQASVYFVGKQTFIDQRWGTRQPITMRDKDFGIVRLRGFGKFSYRVKDASLLINSVVGSQGKLTTEEIVDYLRDQIVAGLTDVFANANISLLEMPSRLDDLSVATRLQVADRFEKVGLELVEIMISSISPPEEVQKAIDARSGMAILNDLNSYTLYQTAKGIEAAGKSEGGGGMGLGLGIMLPAMVQQAMQAAAMPRSAPQAIAATPTAPPNLQSASQQSPLDSVREVAKKSSWHIESDEADRMVVRIAIGPLRQQRVTIETGKSDDRGYGILSVWSVCGPINPSSAALILRSNDQIIHGALALKKIGDTEELVLRSNLLIDTLDALELNRTIASVAWQADQIESQLNGGADNA